MSSKLLNIECSQLSISRYHLKFCIMRRIALYIMCFTLRGRGAGMSCRKLVSQMFRASILVNGEDTDPPSGGVAMVHLDSNAARYYGVWPFNAL